jgi:hypothetical protein
MKSAIGKAWAVAVMLALFCFVPAAFSQNTTMYFNGGYQGGAWCGGSEGCVATGFYDGTINGTAVGPSQPGGPGFVCDDYLDNVTPGETWTASGVDVATLNSSNITNTLFGSLPGGLGIYAELAYLVNQMFTTSPNSAQQAAYSEALWFITSNGKISLSSLDALAQSYVACALTHAGDSLSQYANLWIYTPWIRGTSEAQEMWGVVPVPEGGAAAAYLALAIVTCLGGMFFRSRRPNTAASMA